MQKGPIVDPENWTTGSAIPEAQSRGAMAAKRKVHTAAFKAQVALAAHKGDRTVNELAGHYGVHPTLIHGWKKQLLAGAEEIFGGPAKATSTDAEARQAELFEQIGR